MKTSELTGAALDAWVARADPQCEGCIVHFIAEHDHGPHYVGMHEGSVAFFIPAQTNFRQPLLLKRTYHFAERYQPTFDWRQGGPIIARERIDLTGPDDGATDWWAYCWDECLQENWMGRGETPLIAAMRAYCGAKFGHEVPDSHEAAQPAAK